DFIFRRKFHHRGDNEGLGITPGAIQIRYADLDPSLDDSRTVRYAKQLVCPRRSRRTEILLRFLKKLILPFGEAHPLSPSLCYSMRFEGSASYEQQAPWPAT